jgi:DNA-directed RNA polymerase specialized sigma24 family protein
MREGFPQPTGASKRQHKRTGSGWSRPPPRERREIIDLVYYHDKSVDEAAEILGVPSATVKTRMFYARKKLAVQVQAA